MIRKKAITKNRISLPKSPTGIKGLDEITDGGLPKGRPTLVCGGAGCGKSMLGVEFLVRGVTEFNEPGVLMTFEELPEDVIKNSRSLGFDIDGLIARKKLFLDYVRVERSEIQETGEYDLEGIFVRLNYAIESLGAKRVVLDTIESLFVGLTNVSILRAELRRLFNWLKEKGVTAIITGEKGEGTLTRNGLEEYVSDCVIMLDHRVIDQVSTRRLRVVKYRGSTHGTNEYPFLINENGFSVLPISSLGLSHDVSSERISTGVERLDAMLGGKGYYRGSSVLISGTAGTGKSSLASYFVDAASRRGERTLYFAFEESPQQIIRNMRSIGLNLEPWVKKGLLQFHSSRPTLYGLETHLAVMHKIVKEFQPRAVVVDPISNLINTGSSTEVRSMLLRLVDFFKSKQITALFTSLTSLGDSTLEETDIGVSSIMDTWLLLRDIELGGERNRGIYVLKSRGMAHSNQIREFLISNNGIDIRDVYVGPEGVLTGSMRLAQEAREKADKMTRELEMEAKQRMLERKRAAIEAQIAAMRAEFEGAEAELTKELKQETARVRQLQVDELDMARSRKADRKTAGLNGESRYSR
ncbi:MAG TPA: circadian clock protein KaiC [Candidatus Polarisedimenticolia bacterium]|nr:circadian clock protein KaiC [Candidatus Polarisedimenticolia bacterium]